jgi:hypothetical protein
VTERAFIAPATRHDIPHVVKVMRPWDVRECAISEHTPESALLFPFQIGGGASTRTLFVDGKPLMMGGVRAIGRRKGMIWMLGGAVPPGLGFAVLRLWACELEQVMGSFAEVGNVVPVERRDTIVMLKRLGFDFAPQLLHHAGVDFLRFCMTSSAPKAR